jgi:hypothetical protein
MVEAVAIIMVLFCFGVFVTHAVEGYPMAGDWLTRVRAVTRCTERIPETELGRPDCESGGDDPTKQSSNRCEAFTTR